MMVTTTTESTVTAAAVQARSFADQTRGEQAFSLLVFGLGAAMTGLFGYYLLTNPARLTEIWEWTRSLNIFVQGTIWLLFLPWMICLWMWTWPVWMPVRLVLVAAGLLFSTWLLWPWK